MLFRLRASDGAKAPRYGTGLRRLFALKWTAEYARWQCREYCGERGGTCDSGGMAGRRMRPVHSRGWRPGAHLVMNAQDFGECASVVERRRGRSDLPRLDGKNLQWTRLSADDRGSKNDLEVSLLMHAVWNQFGNFWIAYELGSGFSAVSFQSA